MAAGRAMRLLRRVQTLPAIMISGVLVLLAVAPVSGAESSGRWGDATAPQACGAAEPAILASAGELSDPTVPAPGPVPKSGFPVPVPACLGDNPLDLAVLQGSADTERLTGDESWPVADPDRGPPGTAL